MKARAFFSPGRYVREATKTARGTRLVSGAGRPPRNRYFFAGGFPAPTTLRSNFPLLWAKNRHSEALSQLVVWR